MRVDVKKLLFFGPSTVKEAFFAKAQEMGLVEFIPLKNSAVIGNDHVGHYFEAIKVLKTFPKTEQEDLPHRSDWLVAKATEVSKSVIRLHRSFDRLEEEKRLLKEERDHLFSYGDFSLADVHSIEKDGKLYVQFFSIEKAKAKLVESLQETHDLFLVGEHRDVLYLVSFSSTKETFPELTEHVFTRTLAQVEQRLQDIQHDEASLREEMKAYAPYQKCLHKALAFELNQQSKEAAQKGCHEELEGSLFLAQGWMSVHHEKDLNQLTASLAVEVEPIAIEPADVVPTSLVNKRWSKVGEDVIQVYDVPATSDKDPSLWVLVAFSIFFAMIINDAGYGLVMLATALFLKFKYKAVKGTARRMIALFVLLSCTSILWGFCTSSLFGVDISVKNPIKQAAPLTWLVEKKAAYHLEHRDDVYQTWVKKYPQVATAKNGKEFIELASFDKEGVISYDAYAKFSDNIMLELALLVGTLHVMLSLIRYMLKRWSHIGWILFLIGGYLYFPSIFQATSLMHFVFNINPDWGVHTGLQFLYAGIGIALTMAVIQNKWLGLTEVMTLMQVFADVLSYLRLYALGLAGAIMGATFNEIGESLNYALGIVVIVFGHINNIVLAIMAGIIHGLRLNFLEWYHYSFDGGGKLLKPLRLLKEGEEV